MRMCGTTPALCWSVPDSPISKAMLMKLREFAENKRIDDVICVLVPSA